MKTDFVLTPKNLDYPIGRTSDFTAEYQNGADAPTIFLKTTNPDTDLISIKCLTIDNNAHKNNVDDILQAARPFARQNWIDDQVRYTDGIFNVTWLFYYAEGSQ